MNAFSIMMLMVLIIPDINDKIKIPEDETKPGNHVYHCMIYDDDLHNTILLDGYHQENTPEFGEVWSWNGTAWKQITAPGPQARGWHSMAYDSYRDKIVLFGGTTGFEKTAFGDTWEWDGNKWTEINVHGPAARSDFAMVYDSINRKVVLFGGQKIKNDDAGRKDFGDTWTWDGKIWAKTF